jgi:hypothetical protein
MMAMAKRAEIIKLAATPACIILVASSLRGVLSLIVRAPNAS